MKKILLSLTALALSLNFAFAQQASITYGSNAGVGFIGFDNATEIAIGFLDGGTFTSFHSTAVGAGPGGTTGYANATFQDNAFAYAGENAVIQVTSSVGIGYVASNLWTQPLTTSVSPAPPAQNTFTLSGIDDTQFSVFDNMRVSGTQTAFGASGLTLSVVPEPSTYALLAGFAAFIFVAIRRRNS